MGKLTDYQKKHCPRYLEHVDYKICSKCPNGLTHPAQFCGDVAYCSIKPTTPVVLTIIGRNKQEILAALPKISDDMEHGYMRGKVNTVFWNRDAKVPSYFTYDYDEQGKK